MRAYANEYLSFALLLNMIRHAEAPAALSLRYTVESKAQYFEGGRQMPRGNVTSGRVRPLLPHGRILDYPRGRTTVAVQATSAMVYAS